MFVSSLNSLNDQSLKNYTVTMKEWPRFLKAKGKFSMIDFM